MAVPLDAVGKKGAETLQEKKDEKSTYLKNGP